MAESQSEAKRPTGWWDSIKGWGRRPSAKHFGRRISEPRREARLEGVLHGTGRELAVIAET
ncbi:MAG: hypothetical protein J0J15_00415, partial [Mesorhizobium sp.]|nr:hypothetical protein [Mesorhizobium sp.]